MSAEVPTSKQPDQVKEEAQTVATVRTQRSTIRAWFSCLFVSVILIAVPLMYKFRIVDFTLLNRIGIILNFCAGFMLAPELLGKDALVRMEGHIEKITDNSVSRVSYVYDRIKVNYNKYKVTPSWGEIITFIVFIVIVYIGFIYSSTILAKSNTEYVYNKESDRKVLLFLFFTIVMISFLARIIFSNNTIRRPIERVLSFSIKGCASISILPILMTITLASLIIMISMIILMTMINYLILKPSNYVAKQLAGDDRLRSILVSWGIIFFIVGNLLQFISTFLI